MSKGLMCYPFLRRIWVTFLTIFVVGSFLKMDFDFPSSIYTIAVVAYTIYSWTKKRKKNEDEDASGKQQQEQPKPEAQYKPILGESIPESPGPTFQPQTSGKGRPRSQTATRHRDSQEALVPEHRSLEHTSQKNRSLEEINSPSDAIGFLPHADLRRAIIWSEILKPHPEQERSY